ARAVVIGPHVQRGSVRHDFHAAAVRLTDPLRHLLARALPRLHAGGEAVVVEIVSDLHVGRTPRHQGGGGNRADERTHLVSHFFLRGLSNRPLTGARRRCGTPPPTAHLQPCRNTTVL